MTGVEVAKPPPNPNNLDVLVKELRYKSKAFHAELAVKGETLRDVRQEVIAGMGRQEANQRRAELLPAATPRPSSTTTCSAAASSPRPSAVRPCGLLGAAVASARRSSLGRGASGASRTRAASPPTGLAAFGEGRGGGSAPCDVDWSGVGDGVGDGGGEGGGG